MKDFLKEMVEGKRLRVKPRTRKDGNVKTWSRMILAGCTRMAENGDVWKKATIKLRVGITCTDRSISK